MMQNELVELMDWLDHCPVPTFHKVGWWYVRRFNLWEVDDGKQSLHVPKLG